MIYQKTITTPANTAIADKKISELKVTKGLIYKIEFDFPPGSVGLLGVQLHDGAYQIAPVNRDEWFTGNGYTISFEDLYTKDDDPYIFTIYTYNLDDTFQHAVKVRIGIVLKDAFIGHFLPEKAYSQLVDVFNQIRSEQNQQPKSAIELAIERQKGSM